MLAARGFSEAEIAALRDRAETLLAQLLEQQQDLDARSVASWGDTTWSSYETAARSGDDAFLAEDLAAAVRHYETALSIGAQLLDRYGIFTVHRDGIANGACIRVTPALHNSLADMDRLAEAVRQLAAQQISG